MDIEHDHSEPDEGRSGPEGRQVFWRRWRPAGAALSRPPIVLLHDSLGCVDLWRDFPERLSLAAGRTVVAYDRLGFGRSDVRTGPLPPTFIRDEAQEGLATVIDALGLQSFALFGHSVGGAMAAEAAARFGSRCVALITESAQAFVEARTLEGLRAAQREFADPARRERLARYQGDKTDWVLSAWIDTWLSPGFARWSLAAQIEAIASPMLVIHGDRDEYGSLEHPARIAALGRGRVERLDLANVGHVPHREATGRVLDAVTRFLGPSS